MLKTTSMKFCIAAVVLILISIPLPYWTVIMSAPTYPERNLSMRVYLNYFEGDIQEWNVVGNLVGLKVPPPIPEEVFIIVPIAIGVLILLCIAAIFKSQLLKYAAAGPWIILTALGIWTQYSLYVFGHDLDPNAPLRYIEPFTPPVIGYIKVGRMVTYHLPHVGSLLLILAGVLLFLAYKQLQKEQAVVEISQQT